MIRTTLGAAAIALAAAAHATNTPPTPPGLNAGAEAVATGIGGDATSISHVNTNVSAGGGAGGNAAVTLQPGAVTQHGGAGGNAAVTMEPGAVSQQGGHVNITGGDTHVRAGAVTFSATQPPPVAGGNIAISVSHCLPFKYDNGAEGYREVKVGDETWFIGKESADAAGNFGNSDGTNVGVMGFPLGGQYGTAKGDNKPGWVSKERECIAKKQAPAPPTPARREQPAGQVTVTAPTVQAVKKQVPCKLEQFTDSTGNKVTMCRGPAGSWTRTELVPDQVSVRVAPTAPNASVTPLTRGVTVERHGDGSYAVSGSPARDGKPLTTLWCEMLGAPDCTTSDKGK
ncbi:MAG: hypothetical protein AB1758_18150 [Candidatus Eremiobacterota bacterium]